MRRVAVKMIKGAKGSDRDRKGVAEPVRLYQKGETYEVSEHLAKNFVASGKAEILKNKDASDEAVAPEELEFRDMTVKELQAVAEANGIQFGKDARKAELIRTLEAHFAGQLEG